MATTIYSQSDNNTDTINSTTSHNSSRIIDQPIDYTRTSYGCQVGYGYDIYDPNPICEPLDGSKRPLILIM